MSPALQATVHTGVLQIACYNLRSPCRSEELDTGADRGGPHVFIVSGAAPRETR